MSTEKSSTPVSKVVKNVSKVAFLRPLIASGDNDAKALVAALKEQFPQMTEVTIKTLVVDLKNVKYSVFKDEKIVKGTDGKLAFAPAAEPTEAPEEEKAA